MDVRRFREDLYNLATRACVGDDQEVRLKVFAVADILVNLYRKNLVKINHSALELVCARSLIKEGYGVKVEHRLDKALVCDVMGERGDGAVIVEIETGFIPPEAALEPSAYARTRIASKIARYSPFAGKFALGATPSYVLDIPEFFVKPPRARSMDEAAKIKELTDVRYTKPPISIMELMQARLHLVLLIDVDSANTNELDPETYVKTASEFLGSHMGTPGSGPSPVESGFNISESAGAS
ncbi:MAG: hypothetical protein OK436_02665 [Thaumarchaeota archaeon]|nr:hypothetical protein [Nitrososphaerota archaeon]